MLIEVNPRNKPPRPGRGSLTVARTTIDPSPQDHVKPTLKTIAELTGLAVPTVSRALNDAPDIRAETKATVRKVAAQIGYVPNRAGVRLRTGRTNVISLVLSTEHDMMNHTARMISSIAGGLRDTSFHLVMTPYFPDEDPMRPIRYIVETGSADAIILNQIQPEDPRLAYLLDRGFPFAAHGRSIWRDRHPWADFDNEAFARLGVRALAERGRSNLLLIGPPTTQNYGADLRRGAIDEARIRGLRLRFHDTITSDSTHDAVVSYIHDAVSSDPTIDGVLCGSTNATIATFAGMEHAGFDVGTDIDVVAKEPSPFLKLIREKTLVVAENVPEAGRILARAAMQAIRAPADPPLQWLEVPVAWK